ncbi:hypothetical protein ACQPXM_13925 [Kribbella sp. CA-253562]|uniref:hypothetical protein n=1 Tax=Kribbella sp. CA-253562 TaxID=3239942 RepID=UPI003D92ABF1
MSTIAVVLAPVLTSCDSSDSATPPPFTPSTAPTSASSTPPSPQSEAGAEAQAAYRRYLQAKMATEASGGVNTKPLSSVATGVILASELNQATIFRARKWHSVGQIDVVWTKVLKVGPTGPTGMIGEVTVQACFDSSKVTAVDANGKSVKKPGTPTRWLDEMRMRLEAGAWKASYGLNKAAKC